MKTASKFRSVFSEQEIDILTEAVDGEVNLDSDYPLLYQKAYKFYRNNGIQFLEDDEDDKYSILIDHLDRDLNLI
jgi:hypothetical protein